MSDIFFGLLLTQHTHEQLSVCGRKTNIILVHWTAPFTHIYITNAGAIPCNRPTNIDTQGTSSGASDISITLLELFVYRRMKDGGISVVRSVGRNWIKVQIGIGLNERPDPMEHAPMTRLYETENAHPKGLAG